MFIFLFWKTFICWLPAIVTEEKRLYTSQRKQPFILTLTHKMQVRISNLKSVNITQEPMYVLSTLGMQGKIGGIVFLVWESLQVTLSTSSLLFFVCGVRLALFNFRTLKPVYSEKRKTDYFFLLLLLNISQEVCTSVSWAVWSIPFLSHCVNKYNTKLGSYTVCAHLNLTCMFFFEIW